MGGPGSGEAVEGYAATQVKGEDQQLFVDMVMDELRRLHEGIIARYGVRPSEFRA
jgi:hypothetical protein